MHVEGSGGISWSNACLTVLKCRIYTNVRLFDGCGDRAGALKREIHDQSIARPVSARERGS